MKFLENLTDKQKGMLIGGLSLGGLLWLISDIRFNKSLIDLDKCLTERSKNLDIYEEKLINYKKTIDEGYERLKYLLQNDNKKISK